MHICSSTSLHLMTDHSIHQNPSKSIQCCASVMRRVLGLKRPGWLVSPTVIPSEKKLSTVCAPVARRSPNVTQMRGQSGLPKVKVASEMASPCPAAGCRPGAVGAVGPVGAPAVPGEVHTAGEGAPAVPGEALPLGAAARTGSCREGGAGTPAACSCHGPRRRSGRCQDCAEAVSGTNMPPGQQGAAGVTTLRK